MNRVAGAIAYRRADIGLLLAAFPLFLVAGLAVIGVYWAPNDPVLVDMANRLQPPSLQYPLGTDHMGRCVFSRLMTGAQTTLGVTALTIGAVMCLGIPLGLVCGYLGGRLDAVMMRLADGLLALPEFILAIAIAGFLGPGLTHVMLAVVLFKWISYTRVVRGIVLAERGKDYVLAARAGGCSSWKIMYRHLLPQVLVSVSVLAALDVGKIILIISSLSYLGLGAQPPQPEWGAMLNDGRPYFQTAPQLMLYPGMAIFLVVMSCNVLGDRLRDRTGREREQDAARNE